MTNPQLCRTVAALADYAREKGLIQPDDHTWAVNRLLEEGPLRAYLQNPAPGVELVLTGRNPPDWLLDRADYVTEMKKLRHPYDRGITAREGVEF